MILSWRLIFKSLSQLKKQQPQIANYIKNLIRLHINQHESHWLSNKNRKKIQPNDMLISSTVKLLQNSTNGNQFQRYCSRIKLVEIFTGINKFVDVNCNIRPENQSYQSAKLQGDPQFRSLKSEKQRQFVTKIIKTLFKGNEIYQYSNITDFLRDLRSEGFKGSSEQAFLKMDKSRVEYIKKIIQRDQAINISKQFRDIYISIFKKVQKSHYQQLIQSYLESKFILLDFDDLTPPKKDS